MIPYCAGPELAAIIEYIQMDGRGWPASFTLDCTAPSLYLIGVDGPVQCDAIMALGCTHASLRPTIAVDMAPVPDEDSSGEPWYRDYLVGIVNHELGHALYALPHDDHGVMQIWGAHTPTWPDAQELSLARQRAKLGAVLGGRH